MRSDTARAAPDASARAASGASALPIRASRFRWAASTGASAAWAAAASEGSDSVPAPVAFTARTMKA